MINENPLPLVSIIIPVFNGANYLSEAIDSALAQTYQNIEVIVINDGSNDNGATESIALSYKDKIRYYKKENGGVSSALNIGISNMKGEYFSWLSHDDLYVENKVEKQISLLLKYPPDTILFCSSCQIDKNSHKIKSRLKGIRFNEGYIHHTDMLEILLRDGPMHGCGLLIPVHFFKKYGTFNEYYRFSQDLDLWILFCLNNVSWAYDSFIGVLGRIHNQQGTQILRHLFHQDSYERSKTLIPQLSKISTSKKNYLFSFALRSARHGHIPIIEDIQKVAIKNARFSFKQRFLLQLYIAYGKYRPTLRCLYYYFVKKIKTTK